MDRPVVKGIMIGVVVAATSGAFAGFNLLGTRTPAYAKVLTVDEITTTVTVPRKICADVPVTRQTPVQDHHRAGGNGADRTYATIERRCRTTTESYEKVVGYAVGYRLGDAFGTVRMDHEPDSRIPVKNGRLLLDAPDNTGP